MKNCENNRVPSKNELKILNKIDSSKILRMEDSEYTMYAYQQQYALMLWALQEKSDLSYEEATFICCELFRAPSSTEFYEKTFGLDGESYKFWHDKLQPYERAKRLAEYTGKIMPNTYESDVEQWF